MSARWTPDRFEQAKALIGEGLSRRDAGALLGKSKNAVIGKLYREAQAAPPKPRREACRLRKRASQALPASFSAADRKAVAGGVTVRLIRDLVAADYGLTITQLLAQRRDRTVVEARRVAMFIAREKTELSLPAIGRFLGDRDHSGVLAAARDVGERMNTDAPFAERVGALGRRVEDAVRWREADPSGEVDIDQLARMVATDPQIVGRLTLEEGAALARALLAARKANPTHENKEISDDR